MRVHLGYSDLSADDSLAGWVSNMTIHFNHGNCLRHGVWAYHDEKSEQRKENRRAAPETTMGPEERHSFSFTARLGAAKTSEAVVAIIRTLIG
jgi:hypothetical protein